MKDPLLFLLTSNTKFCGSFIALIFSSLTLLLKQKNEEAASASDSFDLY